VRWASEARERARALVHRSREEAELEEELRFHLEMETEKNVRSGMSREEAARRARLAFGGLEGHREAVRDARGVPVLEELWLDGRYAARSLLRGGSLPWVVVATLALGLGASVAIFSAGRALVTHPVPYPAPERLLSVELSGPRGVGLLPREEDLSVWRREAASLVTLAGHTLGPRIAGNGERSTHTWSLEVTGEWFGVLGANPRLGRTLVPADAAPEVEPVAVISHRLWHELYGGDERVLGRALHLGGRMHTIVGVLAAGHAFPAPVDAWVPLAGASGAAPRAEPRHLSVIGRLAPGADRREVGVALSAVQRALDAERPEAERASTAEILPLPGREGEQHRTALLLLLGAVLFLLLIGTANAAGLMTTRALDRRREMGIRASLGAGRFRLVRQLLVESLLLALVAGAAGVLVAYLTLLAIRHGAPGSLTGQVLGWDRLGLDGTALGFALALSVLTGLLFGLAPALGAVGRNVGAALRAGTAAATEDRGRGRATRALLALEVTLSLTLLLGAGLLARSLGNLMGADPGFRADGVIVMEWSLPRDRFAEPEARRAVQRSLLERVEAMPGVAEAGLASNLPTTLPGFGRRREYRQAGEAEESFSAHWRPVSPEYLTALGVPLKRGRAFGAGDGQGAPRVAIVSESLARRHWRDGANPVGERLIVGEDEWTVVGVAGDVHHFGTGFGPPPTLYVPQEQDPSISGFLAARVDGGGAELGRGLRQEFWSVDAGIAVGQPRSMQREIRDFLADQRMMAYLMSVYAAMALVITVISLYTMVAHSVVRRRRELGIRLALGARPARVVAAALRPGLAWVGAGLLAGILLSAALAQGMAGLLHGVAPLDPVVFLLLPAAVLTLALIAALIPARHATRQNPVETLRTD
jgi:putative ABC transport system permease protein